MKISPKPFAALIALGAALAVPMAFAQSEPSPEVREAQSAAEAAAEPTPQAAPQAGEARQLSWADIDTDGNGTISMTESAAIASLAEVFADADADADGELTADEYKSYVAKAGAATQPADTEG